MPRVKLIILNPDTHEVSIKSVRVKDLDKNQVLKNGYTYNKDYMLIRYRKIFGLYPKVDRYLFYIAGYTHPVKPDKKKLKFNVDIADIDNLTSQIITKNLFHIRRIKTDFLVYLLLGIFIGLVVGWLSFRFIFPTPSTQIPIKPLTKMISYIYNIIGYT